MSELRLLTAADYLAHRQLMSHAFGRGGVVEAPGEPKDPPVETIGIFVDGELASSLTMCPFTVYWPGSKTATLAMGGIAGVASHAEARGQGHVDRLLVESLGRMRASGQVVSALYPFSFSFYGRYGWGWVGEKYGATMPLRELPASKRLARRLTGEAAQAHVTEVYAASGARYRGAFTPGSRNLSGLLSESDRRLTYAYTTKGGYLLWRYPGGDEAGDIREWMTDSPEAERALLALLRDLGVQTRQGRLTLPADTTLFCQTVLNEMDVRAEPVFMGRVVDVAAALGALKTSLPDGTLTLAIDDPHADWNTGTWRVTLEGGAVRVAPTTEAAQLSLGIQAFSQAFWGTPGLERLRRAGKVTVHDEVAFTRLLALLPAAPVMCWDHF